MISLYTDEEIGLDDYEAAGALLKLVGRGMVDRDEHGVRLTRDGEHVAIELFACGVSADKD